MKPVKVAHIITRMIIGGAQENTFYTVEGLQKDPNYEVTLISGMEVGPEGRLDISSLKHVIFLKNLLRRISPLRDLVLLLELFFLFRMEKYDIVHTHSSKAGIVARIAARLAGVPKIIHTIHGLPFHDYQASWLNYIYILLEKLGALLSDKIIVVSPIMMKKALVKGIGRAEQYCVVYSGMELEPFFRREAENQSIRKELNIPDGSIVVGKIARFFPLKGHDDFFRLAFQALEHQKNLIFVLMGDGILFDHFIGEVKDRGYEAYFRFLGLVPPKKVPYFIKGLDILIHTSLREGLARVIPQGFASSIPVISYEIDGACDIISHGEDGFLVPPEDSGALLESFLQLTKDTVVMKRMGEKARRKVDPIFRHDYMVKEIIKVY